MCKYIGYDTYNVFVAPHVQREVCAFLLGAKIYLYGPIASINYTPGRIREIRGGHNF